MSESHGEGRLGLRLRWPSDGRDEAEDEPTAVQPVAGASSSSSSTPETSSIPSPGRGLGPEGDGPFTTNDDIELPRAPEEPDARIEVLHGAVSALSMRVDGLMTSVNSLRLALTDRVTDYAEATASLASRQSSALDEYRHSSERVTSELRRSIADRDQTLHQLVGRLDELSSDVGVLTELFRSQQVDNRTIVATGEKLVRTVTEGLDGFGLRVLDQLAGRAGTDGDTMANVVRGAVKEALAESPAGPLPDEARRAIAEELSALPVPPDAAELQQLVRAAVDDALTATRAPVLTAEQMAALADVVVTRFEQSYLLLDES